MKTKEKFRTAFIILALISMFFQTESGLANWYAGSQRIAAANGVTAVISAPSIPLELVQVNQSGLANWVSTYNNDANGTDWIQSGWRFYYGYTTPKQYVEWCIDCDGSQGTYYIDDTFAFHSWGTTIDYWVSREGNTTQWCAFTAGIVRHCAINLHTEPVTVMAKSEVHLSPLNQLNTSFDQVRYKDPADDVWKLFNSQTIWTEDFPYQTIKFSNSSFNNIRVQTTEIYIPIILK